MGVTLNKEKAAISSPHAAGIASAPLLETVMTSLDDDKAVDIVSIDLHGKTSLADHMVIASGTSQRHVGAMADRLSKKVKEAGYARPATEGLPQCDWVLIDVGDIIVHLFRPEVRDFYALEKMWSAELTDDLAVAVESVAH